MITMKAVVLRIRKDGIAPVYIRVTANRSIAHMRTEYNTTPAGRHGNEIVDPFVLRQCADLILYYTERLNHARTERWHAKDVIRFLETEEESISFSQHALQYIEKLYNEGHTKNAEGYLCALQSMQDYFGVDDIPTQQMTTINVQAWIDSLAYTKRAKNAYPTKMRTVFNDLLRKYNDYDTGDIRVKQNPFFKVIIPREDRPMKKAITAREVREFFAAPLPPTSRLLSQAEYGRDICKLSFCLGAINAIDLWEAKKDQYINGVLHYNRAKTRNHRPDSAYFEMRVPEFIMPIFNKYLNKKDTPWLFDFHDRHLSEGGFSSSVKDGIQKFNPSYTLYTFRHTWATLLQNDLHCTLDQVAFAMNHSRHKITRGYIKLKFDQAWELNEKVIDLVFFTTAGQETVQETVRERFHLGPKHTIKAEMFYIGKVVAEVNGNGFSNTDEVVKALKKVQAHFVPAGAVMNVRINDLENGTERILETICDTT